MNRNDIPNLRQAFRPRDLITALGLLTRLPLPDTAFCAPLTRPAAHAAWAYPLVGLVVAGVGVGIASLLGSLGLSAPVQALFVLLAGALVTGAMHEDGLADCTDGFWGGWTRERRLEIMKDSQIGTYGVIALVLSLVLRWQVITALIEGAGLANALITAAIVSRAAMVWVMVRLPPARDNGLSRHTGTPPHAALGGALLIAGLAMLYSGAALALVVVCALLTFAIGMLARAKIGGQTGDVLGATQQVVEIGALLTLSTLAPF